MIATFVMILVSFFYIMHILHNWIVLDISPIWKLYSLFFPITEKNLNQFITPNESKNLFELEILINNL